MNAFTFPPSTPTPEYCSDRWPAIGVTDRELDTALFGTSGKRVIANNDVQQETVWDNVAYPEMYAPRALGYLFRALCLIPESMAPLAIRQLTMMQGVGMDASADHIICVPGELGPGKTLTDILTTHAQKILQALEQKGVDPELLYPFHGTAATDHLAEKLWIPSLRPHDVVSQPNHKAKFRAQMEKRNIPMLPGAVTYIDGVADAAQELFRKGYAVVTLKDPMSCSGWGIAKVRTMTEVHAWVRKRSGNPREIYVVDAWLSPGENGVQSVSSPSVTFSVWGDGTGKECIFYATDQIVDADGCHQGNIMNSTHLSHPDVQQAIEKTRTWLRSIWYRGAVGIDFLRVEYDGGTVQYYPLELNARDNGSMVGGLGAARLIGTSAPDDRVWASINTLNFRNSQTLEKVQWDLTHTGLWFDPKTGLGVLPTNLASLEMAGKGMLLVVAETQQRAKEVLAMLEGYAKYGADALLKNSLPIS